MRTEAFSYISALLGEMWVENSLDEYQQFRETWSPENRWHHRLPQLSPIVPMLYWNSRANFDDVDELHTTLEPMGFWAGHPKEVLDRLTEEIQYFESFWRDLPDGRGTRNLVWALTWPQRFFSLAHELATAFFFASRDGVRVEPLFLDPQSTAGEPDILAHTTGRSFAVQCKSHDPTTARQFSYDLWQYFAGVFHRAVHDSGRSFHFALNLKGNMDKRQVRKIAKRLSGLVRNGLSTPYPWQNSVGEFQLVELGEFARLEQLARLRSDAFSARAPLYDDVVRLPSLVPSRSRYASITVTGDQGGDVTEVIRRAVTSATKSAVTSDPLIVAVHLYHQIDFATFSQRPLVKDRLLSWSNQFFADNPRLAIVFLSSNFELYQFRAVGDGFGIRHGRSGWVMESPVWNHDQVAALGI